MTEERLAALFSSYGQVSIPIKLRITAIIPSDVQFIAQNFGLYEIKIILFVTNL